MASDSYEGMYWGGWYLKILGYFQSKALHWCSGYWRVGQDDDMKEGSIDTPRLCVWHRYGVNIDRTKALLAA